MDDENQADFKLLARHRSSSSSTTDSTDPNVWPLLLSANFIGHYITGERIGSGSYAEVRECVDTRTLERLAIKVVNKDYLRRQAPRALANQLQEIRLLRRLHHANVIGMRETLSQGPYIYIILDYCSFNLGELLGEQAKRKLDVSLCRDLFYQICAGVCYLHSSGIVHRDIKPQNMLVTNNGILKLIDFGVSQILSMWATEANCFNYEGSPLFQAPEVVASNKQHYDGFKVDVWSCGVTLYLMLYGKYPFDDEALLGLYDKILSQNYSPPKDGPHHAILCDLLAMMLEKDYKLRSSISQIKSHPWLQLRHAAGSADDKDEDTEFIDFVASKQDHEGLTQGSQIEVPFSLKQGTCDTYRSMSVLPYLYQHHFPQLPVRSKPDTKRAHQQSQNSATVSSTSTSSACASDQTSSESNDQGASDPGNDILDEQVEWGTIEQYNLMKVPQVRANRLRIRPRTRLGKCARHRSGRLKGRRGN